MIVLRNYFAWCQLFVFSEPFTVDIGYSDIGYSDIGYSDILDIVIYWI